MSRAKKRGPGRPPLGAAARNKVVTIKLTQAEYDAIAEAVEKENREMIEDGNDDGQPATVASWIRDQALDPLGLAGVKIPMLVLLALALGSPARADTVRDPYKATIDVLHGTGERAPLKTRCGDPRWEYLVRNVEQIRSISIGDDSMRLELASGAPVIITRTIAGRGFIDVDEYVSLYVYADPARELVHVGIIVRNSLTNRLDACAEKWTGKGKRR